MSHTATQSKKTSLNETGRDAPADRPAQAPDARRPADVASLRDFALASRKAEASADKPRGQKLAVAYEMMDENTLLVTETTKTRSLETTFNFLTGSVSQDKIYANGQIASKDIPMANHTDTDSIERVRQKLIEMGGTPPAFGPKKEPVGRDRPGYVCGFHAP